MHRQRSEGRGSDVSSSRLNSVRFIRAEVQDHSQKPTYDHPHGRLPGAQFEICSVLDRRNVSQCLRCRLELPDDDTELGKNSDNKNRELCAPCLFLHDNAAQVLQHGVHVNGNYTRHRLFVRTRRLHAQQLGSKPYVQ